MKNSFKTVRRIICFAIVLVLTMCSSFSVHAGIDEDRTDAHQAEVSEGMKEDRSEARQTGHGSDEETVNEDSGIEESGPEAGSEDDCGKDSGSEEPELENESEKPAAEESNAGNMGEESAAEGSDAGNTGEESADKGSDAGNTGEDARSGKTDKDAGIETPETDKNNDEKKSSEKAENTDNIEKTEKTVKTEKTEKTEKTDQSENVEEKPEEAEAPEKDTEEKNVHTEDEILAAQKERNVSSLELGYIPGEILVVYSESVADESIKETAEKLDGEVSDVLGNGDDTIAVVEISEETTVEKAIEEYESDPNVAYAEPNYILVNMGDGNSGAGEGFDYLRAINAAGAKTAANKWKTAGHELSAVSVGIIDTGFDLNNSLIQSKYSSDKSICVTRSKKGSKISHHKLTQNDLKTDRHGTNVTGVFINTVKSAGISGGELILADAAVDDDKQYTVDSVVYAVNYLAGQGVDVINMSIGIKNDSNDTIESEVLAECLRKARQNNNIVMVCAADNKKGFVSYPADDPNTVSVMAVDSADETCTVKSASGKHIAAPGMNIKGADGSLNSGTSLSTPMVTAAVTATLAVSPGLSFDRVLDILISQANIINGIPVLNIGNMISHVTGVEIPVSIDINEAEVNEKTMNSTTYNEDWTDDLKLKYYGRTLEEGVDYSMTKGQDIINDETISVSAVIKGKGSFSGKRKLEFTMKKLDINDCEYQLSGSSLYNGRTGICPEISLSYFNKSNYILEEGRDYTKAYADNIKSGKGAGKIYVTGKGIFKGEREIVFDITTSSTLIKKGKCGDNVIYRLYADGRLLISGKGEITAQFAGMSFKDSNGIKVIPVTARIGDGVTKIGEKTFYNCVSLEKVDIPKGVKTISDYAFSRCLALKEIDIPDTVTTIGKYAFQNCAGLTEIVIPRRVKEIGEGAFVFCRGLSKITIPNGVTVISDSLLSCCTGLTDISLPAGLEKIGSEAFCSCEKLQSISIPDSVSEIGIRAFMCCIRLNRITLPEKISEISPGLFMNCKELTRVVIPKGVTKIGRSAFSGCYKLNKITIPKGVTRIGATAFFYCYSLTSITIPKGVVIIENGVFSGCSGLTSITIPEGVVKIGNSAFSGCSGLTSVSIPGSLTELNQFLFANCKSLNRIEIPKGVLRIGPAAFSGCSGLTGISLPKTITTIEGGAFSGCSGLRRITLPGNITEIGYGTFKGCSGLTQITLPEKITEIGEYAFSNCTGLSRVQIPKGVTTIGEHAFAFCVGLKEVVLPEKITEINAGLFYDCPNLTSIEIPKTVTVIRSEAFAGCGLTGISLPNGLKTIENMAFESCIKLKKIKIPDTVTKIGSHAFSICKGLTSISLSKKLTEIYGGTFEFCDSLVAVDIPEGVKKIWGDAFYYCHSLAGIRLPGSITSIGQGAFYHCENLKEALFPMKEIEIGKDAFKFCGLSEVTLLSTEKVNLNNYKKFFDDHVIPCFVEGITDDIVKQPCGAKAKWSLDTEGNLLISGSGEIDAWNGGGPYVWEDYSDIIRTITIENGITSTGKNSFRDLISLEKVTLPPTLEEIGDYAFAYDSRLSELTIPKKVKNIGIGAFYGDRGLTGQIFEDYSKIETISTDAFAYCTSIVEIDLRRSSTLSSIMPYAFNNCTSLEKFIASDSLIAIGDYAFFGCESLKLFSSKFPSQLKSIGKAAFAKNSSLELFGFGDDLVSIGETAFADCSSLKSIPLDRTQVNHIGDYAFYNCSKAKTITLPDTPLEIGDYSFYGCDRLSDVVFPESVRSIGMFSFAEESKLSSVSFEGKATQIGDFAFYHDPLLSKVRLPGNTTRISKGTFALCDSLNTDFLKNKVKGKWADVKTSDYNNYFIDSPEVNTESLSMAVGTWEDFNSLNGAEVFPKSSRDVVASVVTGNGRYSISANAPGKAIVLIKTADAKGNKTVTSRYVINVKIPIEADPDGLYKEVSYTKDGKDKNEPCAHECIRVTLVERTCGKDGVEADICCRCGETVKEYTLPATGKHQYEEYTIIKEPTYTEEGEGQYTCTQCGHTRTVMIPVKTDPANPTVSPVPTQEPAQDQVPTVAPGETASPGQIVSPRQTAVTNPAAASRPTETPKSNAAPKPSVTPKPTAAPEPFEKRKTIVKPESTETIIAGNTENGAGTETAEAIIAEEEKLPSAVSEESYSLSDISDPQSSDWIIPVIAAASAAAAIAVIYFIRKRRMK